MVNKKESTSAKTQQAAYINNLNNSFDTSAQQSVMEGSSSNGMSKKMKIPKLNLEVLPNYHGKSNKSLNQSLMDTYEKKNATSLIGQKC